MNPGNIGRITEKIPCEVFLNISLEKSVVKLLERIAEETPGLKEKF